MLNKKIDKMPDIVENIENNDNQDVFLKEINKENAQNAEETEVVKREEIPFLNYEEMQLEELLKELKRLIQNEQVQTIKKHVDAIRQAFEKKSEELYREKQQKYVEDGGQEEDFQYKNEFETEFNDLYLRYKEERDKYYTEREKIFAENKSYRENIINGIRDLVDVESVSQGADAGLIFKKYKELRDLWFNAGPVSRKHYDDLWNNFNHHSDRVFDYLEINKELREEEYKRNLEKKKDIIERAKALLDSQNIDSAFRELQNLHRLWKEETGSVDRELREELWNQFSKITKDIHELRQERLKDLEKQYLENEEKKNKIIEEIKQLLDKTFDSHPMWQEAFETVENLTNQYYEIGKVRASMIEEFRQKIKEVRREFNKKRTAYYRENRKKQQEISKKRNELIEIAKTNENRTDWAEAVPLMKKIQEDWKELGFVSGKNGSRLWEEFRDICNRFFDKYNQQRKVARGEGKKIINEKNKLFDKVKEFEPTDNYDKDVQMLKEFEQKWVELIQDPANVQNERMNTKFERMLKELYNKIDAKNKQSMDILKYSQRLETMEKDPKTIASEENFVKKKIEKIESEVGQMESNLALFNNVDRSNPLVRDAYNNLEHLKSILELWQNKLKELKNFLNKAEQ